jgi:hypothetical protein
MSEPNAVENDELAQLEAELEALRKEREDFDQAKAQASKAQKLRDAIEQEKRELAEAKALADLEAKHGAVGKYLYRVNTGEGMVVVKRPNHLFYKRFVDEGKTNTEAYDKLVRPCLVYPDKVRFDQICEAEPGTLVKCADAVVWLAGTKKSDLEGK